MLRAMEKDRPKRDEWSEGAVSSLLDAYEAKWVMRNRAKLKGEDWEDVARQVSARGDCTKPPKSLTQCKNKIESMKKRYRSECSNRNSNNGTSGGPASTVSWPLFDRLDSLLRCRSISPTPLLPPPPTTAPLLLEAGPSGREEDDNERNHQEGLKKKKRRMGKGRKHVAQVAKSIRCLADAMVKAQKLRLEVWRETERVWGEAEARRKEIELKKMEIIAETQMKIARLFANGDKHRQNNDSVAAAIFSLAATAAHPLLH